MLREFESSMSQTSGNKSKPRARANVDEDKSHNANGMATLQIHHAKASSDSHDKLGVKQTEALGTSHLLRASNSALNLSRESTMSSQLW